MMGLHRRLLAVAFGLPLVTAVLLVPVADAQDEAPVMQEDAAAVERLTAHIAETWKTPLPAAQRIVEAAFSQAQLQRISPTLILAVVAQESSFKPTARSSYGAEGLMQVSARHHPDKLKGLRRDALLKPETNIRVGTQVLAEYLEQHNGRLDQALRKYSGNASSYPRKIRAFWARLEQVRRTASFDSAARPRNV